MPPAAIELIRQARQGLGYGAARTRLWLQRVHGVRLTMGTIQRVFRDIGLPRLRRTRKREPRRICWTTKSSFWNEAWYPPHTVKRSKTFRRHPCCQSTS